MEKLDESYMCRVVFYLRSSFSGLGAGEGVVVDWDCSSFSGLYPDFHDFLTIFKF